MLILACWCAFPPTPHPSPLSLTHDGQMAVTVVGALHTAVGKFVCTTQNLYRLPPSGSFNGQNIMLNPGGGVLYACSPSCVFTSLYVCKGFRREFLSRGRGAGVLEFLCFFVFPLCFCFFLVLNVYLFPSFHVLFFR